MERASPKSAPAPGIQDILQQRGFKIGITWQGNPDPKIDIARAADKLTILEIKAERVPDPSKLFNVRRELALLSDLKRSRGVSGGRLDSLTADLKRTNCALWEIEDAIRQCERMGDFGPDFVALARRVYQENDRRAALKRDINVLFGSAIVEEKHYSPY